MNHIAIFASGTGSNALKIIEFLAAKNDMDVGLIVTNNKNAGVLEHAKNNDIPHLIISKSEAQNASFLIEKMILSKISFIVLAGYLLKIPARLIAAFPHRIVNIHPALLPKYGGKGMYGIRVHQAVVDNNEKESGITIHYVNEHYDEGDIIAQYKCPLQQEDSASTLAARVLALEHKYFPKEVYLLCSRQ